MMIEKIPDFYGERAVKIIRDDGTEKIVSGGPESKIAIACAHIENGVQITKTRAADLLMTGLDALAAYGEMTDFL